jgi:hypothetical protein
MKTLELSEPLDGTTTATIEIHSDSGNLTIDKLAGGDPLLASGSLQYDDNQQPPTPSLNTRNGQATLSVDGRPSRRPWLHLPWAACNAATDWRIHINPAVPSAITARSGGGNVKVDLSGMSVTGVTAETGGGNVDVVLPDSVSGISVQAATGAGNVSVHVPDGIALRVHASSGLGKVSMDPRLSHLDRNTYESPDYEHAARKVEITVKSGAGNVSVETN